MNSVSSFSDKFLIRAASSYAYDMSSYDLYKDPVLTVALNLEQDFLFRYEIELAVPTEFERDGKRIDLRYLLFKDTLTDEYALVFQGSNGDIIDLFSGKDNDWSNNLNSVAHLPLDNFDLAKSEFEYLRDVKGYNITAVSGNSLGGGYALYLADDNPNLRLIGLNPAPRAFNEKYVDNGHSTILITSSDILSKLVMVDKSRYGEVSDENAMKMSIDDKLTKAYGYKPHYIKRMIPYTNESNLFVGHTGSNRSYRDITERLYMKNQLFYNAKIIASSEERLNFSKRLLKTQYQKLNQKEYISHIDNHIYPALTENSQRLVDTYRLFPQIDEFIQFDINTKNLKNSNYIITKTEEFINNFNASLYDYNLTSKFLNENSKVLLESLDEESPLGYNRNSFFANNLKIKLDWDWNMIKLLVGMPLSVKMKLGELVEKNWYFFYQLGTQINSEYQKFNVLKDNDVKQYIEELKHAFIQLDELSESMNTVLNRISSNFEMMLVSKVSLIKVDNLYEIGLDEKNIDLNDYSLLHNNLMSKQYKESLKALENSKSYIEDNIEILATSSSAIIDEIINSLEQGERDVEKKLYKQFKGIQASIDAKSFLTLLLFQFKHDIATLLINESVAMEVLGNVIQYKQLLDQINYLIENIEQYSKSNLNHKEQTIIHKDLDNLKIINANMIKLLELIANK